MPITLTQTTELTSDTGHFQKPRRVSILCHGLRGPRYPGHGKLDQRSVAERT